VTERADEEQLDDVNTEEQRKKESAMVLGGQ